MKLVKTAVFLNIGLNFWNMVATLPQLFLLPRTNNMQWIIPRQCGWCWKLLFQLFSFLLELSSLFNYFFRLQISRVLRDDDKPETTSGAIKFSADFSQRLLLIQLLHCFMTMPISINFWIFFFWLSTAPGVPISEIRRRVSKPDRNLIYTFSSSTATGGGVFVDNHRYSISEISVRIQGYNLYYTNNSIVQYSKVENKE